MQKAKSLPHGPIAGHGSALQHARNSSSSHLLLTGIRDGLHRCPRLYMVTLLQCHRSSEKQLCNFPGPVENEVGGPPVQNSGRKRLAKVQKCKTGWFSFVDLWGSCSIVPSDVTCKTQEERQSWWEFQDGGGQTLNHVRTILSTKPYVTGMYTYKHRCAQDTHLQVPCVSYPSPLWSCTEHATPNVTHTGTIDTGS